MDDQVDDHHSSDPSMELTERMKIPSRKPDQDVVSRGKDKNQWDADHSHDARPSSNEASKLLGFIWSPERMSVNRGEHCRN